MADSLAQSDRINHARDVLASVPLSPTRKSETMLLREELAALRDTVAALKARIVTLENLQAIPQTRRVRTQSDQVAIALHVVGDQFKVSEEMLRGLNRKARIALARAILYFILYDLIGCTYESIGRRLNRDHSTIMYGVNRIRNRMGMKESDRAELVACLRQFERARYRAD